MIIQAEHFIYIDILIVVVVALAAFVAVKNGLLLQIVSLFYTAFCLFVSWLLAPVLASNFPLVHLDNIRYSFNLEVLINSLIYCIVVFVILRIIYCFVSPLLKSISSIPIIGSLNRIGGFVLGLINGFIIVLLLGMLLKTPIIQNGFEVKNGTIFKYTDMLSEKALEFTVEHINLDSIKDKVSDFDADEARSSLVLWMKEQGIINE